MFDLVTGIVAYCLLLGVGFLVLWLYYDRRDRAHYAGTRQRATFHCIRCDHVYTGAREGDTAACPRCGHPNGRLRF